MPDGVPGFPISRRGLFGAAAGLAATAALAACGSSKDSSTSSTTTAAAGGSDPKSIATDAYIFGYPLVLMDATRATAAPTNTLLRFDKTPSPDDKTVVTPNVDTLYSQAWLDLRAEPMVLQIPVMPDGAAAGLGDNRDGLPRGGPERMSQCPSRIRKSSATMSC
ncbi:DUF1254 domain-containing protein, partial [Nocardia sp. NPDC059228]|uniref:DUF1254 domain-containing protein n=1 Tax=Nocardia sp. NPDC059228 TaxID=3346777 RepID=UPI00369CA4E2